MMEPSGLGRGSSFSSDPAVDPIRRRSFLGLARWLRFRWVLLATLLFCVVSLDWSTGARRTADTESYEFVARQPIGCWAFWFGIRAPALPLALKAVGLDLGRLQLLQVAVSCAAWSILALIAARSVVTPRARRLAWAGLAGMAISSPVLVWSSLALSESLALSLTALVAAAIVAATLGAEGAWQPAGFRVPAPVGWIGCGVLGLSFSLSRDTSLYQLGLVALGLGAMARVAAVRGDRPACRAMLGGVLVAALAGAVGWHVMVSSGRWHGALVNVLVMRLLPDPGDHGWFAERYAIPVDDCVRARYGKFFFDDEHAVFRCTEFIRWVQDHGRGAYERFLIEHLPRTVWEAALAGNEKLNAGFTTYQRPADRLLLSRLLGWLTYPRLPWPGFCLALLALAPFACVPASAAARGLLRASGIVAWTALAGLYVGWHGDTGEVVRHLSVVSASLRISFWLAVVSLLEARDSRGAESVE